MDALQKFNDLKKKISNLSDLKIRYEERYKTEMSNLENLVKEIKAKGYDPQNLTKIKKEKEEQLQALLNELELATKEASEKLSQIEAN